MSNYSTQKCKVLDHSLSHQCAEVMAKSFLNSPVYKFIFSDCKDEHERLTSLTWFFERRLNMILKKSPSALRGIVDYDKDKTPNVIACLLWNEQSLEDFTTWDMIQVGLWEIPIRFGFNTMKRMMDFVQTIKKEKDSFYEKYDAEERSNAKDRKVVRYMLNHMVVRTEFQGQGIGSSALKQTFLEYDQKDVPAELWLYTQEKKNVTFYSRLGFEVVHEKAYADSGSNETESCNFHQWTMKKML